MSDESGKPTTDARQADVIFSGPTRVLGVDPGSETTGYGIVESDGRRLTLYVRTEASRNRETAFRYARENNVGVFYWIDREVGYALASADLSKDELLRLANLVYKKLEP